MMDYYYIYRLIRSLSTPFDKWPAFYSNVIDKDGNIIAPEAIRTPSQRTSFNKIDLIALKLKKMLASYNIRPTPLLTTTAALALLKEGNDISDSDLEYVVESLVFSINEEDGGGEPSTSTANIDGYQNARGIVPAIKFKRKPKREENPFKT